MGTNGRNTSQGNSPRWYRGADVPNAVIRRFAREVAEQFHPDKIILFGSHAYGTPHADSDVDILVVMPCRNELDQAVKICWTIDRTFALDLIVRTPKDLNARLDDGDLFHTHIVTHGKVLYEKGNARVDRTDPSSVSGPVPLQRFVDRLSGNTAVVTPPPITSRQRVRQIKQAEEELRRAGMRAVENSPHPSFAKLQ